MELRKLDVTQANQHVQYLCSFMPDSYVRRGGEWQAKGWSPQGILCAQFLNSLIPKIKDIAIFAAKFSNSFFGTESVCQLPSQFCCQVSFAYSGRH